MLQRSKFTTNACDDEFLRKGIMLYMSYGALWNRWANVAIMPRDSRNLELFATSLPNRTVLSQFVTKKSTKRQIHKPSKWTTEISSRDTITCSQRKSLSNSAPQSRKNQSGKTTSQSLQRSPAPGSTQYNTILSTKKGRQQTKKSK